MTIMSSDNLDTILKLVNHFITLQKGTLIKNHRELVEFFNIIKSKHEKHPHKNKKVYISRKSLKHFTERRMEDFIKNHTKKESIESILFLINNTKETIINFDSYEYKPPISHFYKKDYSNIGEPTIIVLLEENEKNLEIKSIYFNKVRKRDK